MNILYLSERDPRDYNFGGAQRTHFIWNALKQLGNVYCVYYSFYGEDEEVAPDIWNLKKHINVNKKQYFWYRVWRRLLKNLEVLPLWPTAPKSLRTPEEIFGVKFDILVARYCFDLCEMHLWNYPKVVVDFDDHPIEMFETVKKENVKPCLRLLSKYIIGKQLEFIEKKITKGWIANPDQVKLFHNKGDIIPLKNVALAPSEHYNPQSQRRRKLITVGVMNYLPNYIGVDRFLNEVWPMVHIVHPDIEYHIIGKNVPKQYYEKWNSIEGVKIRGYVDDLEKEYETCIASVVPVDCGGGTCIKTLESMSFSRICLSTPFGARGLECQISENDIGIYIYRNDKEFLELLEQKALDSKERFFYEKRAKMFIEQNHSIQSFTATVINTLK